MTLRPPFSVHFIDCGQGNMTLLVTPTAAVVYDCRITAENSEEILQHLRSYIPKREIGGKECRWIDWFICSHRDQDHIHGLSTLHESFPIRGIVDPGTTSGSVDGDENRYYMALRRKLREVYGDGAVMEPTPSTTPLFDFGGVRFYCLCSGVDCDPSEDGHYGNNVFQVEYAGNRVLLTGDSDWRAWKEKIVPTFGRHGLLKTTILVASHHGSRSFFVDCDPDVDEDEAWKSAYEAHLAHISPSMTIISVGEQKVHNHPNETALERYERATRNEQVYLTRSKGTLVGKFYSDGRWTVTPATFLRGWDLNNYCPNGKGIDIKCSVYANGKLVREVDSGESLPIGHELRFAVSTRGGLVQTIANAKYTFEVSNGGAGADADHDEIYKKKSSESGAPNTFTRHLEYHGTHMLRCRVRNGSQTAQRVFIIHGIKAAG